MFATTAYPKTQLSSPRAEITQVTHLEHIQGYPPMHTDPMFIPFLMNMNEKDYLTYFRQFLENHALIMAKEFIVNSPFGILHYKPGEAALKAFKNPKDSELTDTGESAHEILAKITQLGECRNLHEKLRSLITGQQIRTHVVSSRGVTIPTQGLVIATCANYQELNTYFDLGVKLKSGDVISWTNTAKANLKHSGDPFIQFPGSDGITLKKTLTHFVSGFENLSDTTGVIRFSAYNNGPMQQWNSEKCQCRPFAMAILPTGEIFVLPVPMSDAQVGQNSACIAAVFKISDQQMTIRPACIAANGSEQRTDSAAMSRISSEGIRMAELF